MVPKLLEARHVEELKLQDCNSLFISLFICVSLLSLCLSLSLSLSLFLNFFSASYGPQ